MDDPHHLTGEEGWAAPESPQMSEGLQRNFSAAIQSVISGSITAWYGNCNTQDWKSLHRVIRCAERITRTASLCLQDI